MENNVFNNKSTLDDFSEKELLKLMFTHLVGLGRKLDRVEQVLSMVHPKQTNEIIEKGVSTSHEYRIMQDEYSAIWYELELYLHKMK